MCKIVAKYQGFQNKIKIQNISKSSDFFKKFRTLVRRFIAPAGGLCTTCRHNQHQQPTKQIRNIVSFFCEIFGGLVDGALIVRCFAPAGGLCTACRNNQPTTNHQQLTTTQIRKIVRFCPGFPGSRGWGSDCEVLRDFRAELSL